VETPLPHPNEDGESTIVLGPFDRGYQRVRSLHAVVRWGDTWDSNFGRDYNFPLTIHADDGPALRFLSPRAGEGARGDVMVKAETDEPARLDLWLDGRALHSETGQVALVELPGPDLALGPHELVARAEAHGSITLDEVAFWRLPPASPPREPGYPLSGGATRNDDGTVTFALYAPGLRFVSLVGDFNGWEPEADLMHATPDGTWWIQRPLAPGTYLYQYLLEGARLIADPYARELVWEDDEGRAASDSALARTVLRLGQEAFCWPDSGFVRPELARLILYEFHVQDFSRGGGYCGVAEKLDYLADLGVTALEPLPFTAFPGDDSWGYNPAFHFAPEPSFGTPDDLRHLIAGAHARGMAVVMDMVLNHMDRSAALWQLYREDYDASPYFRFYDGPNWGFPDFDQRSPVFRAYAAEVLGHWLSAYRVDGFRYDATRWVEWQGFNDWGVSWFAYAAAHASPGSYQIAEHIPSEPALVNTTPVDMEWDAHFRWRIRDTLLRRRIEDPEELAAVLDPTPIPYRSGFQRMVYIESHDESRFLAELLDSGMAEAEALERVKTSLAVLLTVPGVPMLYSGQEFGEIAPRIVGPNPLHWERLKTPAYAALHAFTRQLVDLRSRHPALREDGLALLANDERSGVLAYQRLAEEQAVVVVVNVSGDARETVIPLPVARPYRILGGAQVTFDGAAANVSLGPGEAAILVAASQG
jgi:1,4-alpha-glucan branching enzyme